jgi:hypothetical protein
MSEYTTNNLKMCAYLDRFGAKWIRCKVRPEPYYSGGESVYHTFSHPDIDKLVQDFRSEPFIQRYKWYKVLSENTLAEHRGKV